MSIPALRQPKFANKVTENLKKAIHSLNFVIVTMRNDVKLVISSDAYHGILTEEEIYKCVFCDTVMELDNDYMALHKSSLPHTQMLSSFAYVEEYGQNLIRKINKDNFHCTICNVIVLSPFLIRHIASEVHTQELERAATRTSAYSSS